MLWSSCQRPRAASAGAQQWPHAKLVIHGAGTTLGNNVMGHGNTAQGHVLCSTPSRYIWLVKPVYSPTRSSHLKLLPFQGCA